MPRPLVLKITSNTSEPNKRATGTIDVALFRESGTRITEHPPVLYTSLSLEEQPGLVRNLVSKYEPPGLYSSSLKYKSKSMMDLNDQYKPGDNDDAFYHKSNCVDDESSVERRNNFQQSLRRFQNPTGSNTMTHSENTRILGHSIREKARKLLEATKHDYFWFNEVVELLKQIVNDDEHQPVKVNEERVLNENVSEFVDESVNVTRSRTVSVTSTNSHEESDLSDLQSTECGLNVNKMKQLYEEKVLQKPHLFVELTRNQDHEHQSEKECHEQKPEHKLKVPLKYFGKQDEGSDCSTPLHTGETQAENSCGVSTQLASVTSSEVVETGISDAYGQHIRDNETQISNLHNEIEETSMLDVEASDEAKASVSNTDEKVDDTPAVRTKVHMEALSNNISNVYEKLEEVPLLDLETNKEAEKGSASNLLKEPSAIRAEATEDSVKTDDSELHHGTEHAKESGEAAPQLTVTNLHKEPENLEDSSTFQTESHEEAVQTTTSNLHEPNSLPKSTAEANEEAVKTIEEIMTTIEECNKTIDTISSENKMDANYLNDILIQMLLRLDDLKIYDDGVIITIRRKAFAFAEGCIRKLKAKVFHDDHHKMGSH